MNKIISILLLFCSFFASIAIEAQPTAITDMPQVYLVGTATENGQAIAMQPLAPKGQPNGIYELFTQLRKGTYSLQTISVDGTVSIAGRGSKGTIKIGGKPWKSTESQVVRLRYDSNKGRLDIMPATISVRGNIIEGETILPYAGNGKFCGRVEMTKKEPEIFSQKNFYFALNGSDSLSICRQKGSRTDLAMPAEGYDTEKIRINQGSYLLTLNTSERSWQVEAPIDEHRISVFGSSVANGQGAKGNHGYAYQYGQLLQSRYEEGTSAQPFHTSGVAIGGNTTKHLLARYDEMTHDFGRYVVIGLSMANEGLSRTADKESVYSQFSTNMQTLISMIRADGKVPVVTNNYANNDYTATEYAYIQRINHDIQLWNVPSINLLGAIDRGDGHWADGYFDDNWHPNTIGHEEMSYAFPPSLFDALAAGKPLPERQECDGITLFDGAAISYVPESTCHSFTISVRAATDSAANILKIKTEQNAEAATVAIDSSGHLEYTSPDGSTRLISSGTYNDSNYHYFTLTHYYASGRTQLYADDKLIGSADEGGGLSSFYIGGEASIEPIHVGEVFVWRSGMNQSEISSLCAGEMLKSSLEVYTPFTMSLAHSLATAKASTKIENKAQSLAALVYSHN